MEPTEGLRWIAEREGRSGDVLRAVEGVERLGQDGVGKMFTKMGGVVGIRWCSALVKPESPEVLAAIREHPQLKGYLEQGAPPGYLLLKSRSNPNNFVRRCRDLGFAVHTT